MKTPLFRAERMDGKGMIEGYYVKSPSTIQHRMYWQPFDEATSNTYHEINPYTLQILTSSGEWKDIDKAEIR
jgi:hypothetical protein